MSRLAPRDRTVRRTAGRIALLDPDDRVLLSNDAWGGRSWWCTPGGGVESDESVEAAALREVYEETGFGDVELGALVVRHHWRSIFLDVLIDQHEWIFVGRTSGGLAVPAKLDALERTFMNGFRWWAVPDLVATNETVYPAGLGLMLASVLQDGPPATPWVVDVDELVDPQ
jgi:8-oxo-dGTP pyrophosphatase MutT (NUDIX family)